MRTGLNHKKGLCKWANLGDEPRGLDEDGESKMKIVSIINYKGGVGKTSLTANLGAELAWRGKKVLLLDLDAQASLTFSFMALRGF